MNMDLNKKKINNVIVIYLSGRLDVHLSAEIEKEINSTIQNEPDSHLLLNLKDVEYMSSSGLRIFVSTMRILKESNRKLKLSNMNNAVKKIFEVVELMDMFDIFDSEEEALKSFNKA
jgi:anti-anti-sigma factor